VISAEAGRVDTPEVRAHRRSVSIIDVFDEPTWRGGFRRDQQRRGLMTRTIRERDLILDSLTRWADGVDIFDLTREEVQQWLDHSRLSARSRAIYLSTVHNFFLWAIDEGLTGKDPTSRIRRPRVPRLVPRPIGDDDLEYAIRLAPPRLKAMFCLAAYEGLRCKEIAELRREDVMDRHRPPILRVWNGKGGHQAILPLNPRAAAALRVYGMPAKGLIFRRLEDGRPLAPGTISSLGGQYLRRLGIDASMHQLRHWFGTEVWKLTKDMRVTQELMRHASPHTTSIYTAFDRDLAAQAVNSLGAAAG
jgi:integrase